MTRLRFDVFGRIYEIRRESGEWRSFAVGADGKRGPSGFEIPAFIAESELEQYLYDLFHEHATGPGSGVKRLPS